MTLNEFIKDMSDHIEGFKIYWDVLNKQNPKFCPLDMPSGDWIEQFQLFCKLADGQGKTCPHKTDYGKCTIAYPDLSPPDKHRGMECYNCTLGERQRMEQLYTDARNL